MGNTRMNITLDGDLEKKFRDTVAQTLGYKKGNLQTAIEEALEDWIEKQAEERATKNVK